MYGPQILRVVPSAHIMACAPSNSAADLLAERLLLHVPASQMFRLNAASRSLATMPACIKVIIHVLSFLYSGAIICTHLLLKVGLRGQFLSADMRPSNFNLKRNELLHRMGRYRGAIIIHSSLFKSLNISSCQLIHNYIMYNCIYIYIYAYI